MRTYSVEETARKIGKSPQTVRAYVKRGILEITPDNGASFQITGESIRALSEKLAEAMQGLRHKRSETMKQKWQLIKSA